MAVGFYRDRSLAVAEEFAVVGAHDGLPSKIRKQFFGFREDEVQIFAVGTHYVRVGHIRLFDSIEQSTLPVVVIGEIEALAGRPEKRVMGLHIVDDESLVRVSFGGVSRSRRYRRRV